MSGSFKGLGNITSELTYAETWAENLVWTSVKLPIADTFIKSFMEKEVRLKFILPTALLSLLFRISVHKYYIFLSV